ncbi:MULTISPECIES: dihydroneopterin aldolase [unclassified Spirosoma]|uniref:dihydroneopterin aldolase n=1 Tax=unclassified Spirosoma TaxID=2621999 RepID=UPI0009619350|nr:MULTISPECIES: dihydroneopterin aldolase [unclassified Spirosoma]MBN8824594.1 dihydroneopterin aldolase [Spirosoma sp.]OJW71050.1 MAG: dihydroneopterin aldolase [Spirosoma sp. 48-14]
MGTIALEGLEFFSYHGFYDEEQKIGNKYSVDILVTTDFSEAARRDRLSDTVSYEDLYRITADVMKQPARLLEHIAHQIIQEIRTRYNSLETVEVSVSKFNPPIGGVCHRARITMKG